VAVNALSSNEAVGYVELHVAWRLGCSESESMRNTVVRSVLPDAGKSDAPHGA